MGEQDPKGPTTASWSSNSLGRALIEGLRITPAHNLLAEFGELKMLRATLNALTFPIAVLDSQGRILVANSAWHAGVAAGRFLGAASAGGSNYPAALDATSGECAGGAQALAQGIRDVAAGTCNDFGLEYTLSGTPDSRHFRVRVVPCAGKEPASVVVMHEDVSAQKHAERATGQSRLLMDTVLDTVGGGLSIAESRDATKVRISRRGHELLGYALDGIEECSLNEYVSRWNVLRPDGARPSRPEDLPLVRALCAGEVIRDQEIVLRMPDDSQLTILCSASPVRDGSGQLQGAVVAWRDVTEGRLLAEQLRQSQKMEAIGLLAGGVAHDFNNVLMVIQGYSRMLRLRVSGDENARGAVEEIQKAVERASVLTRQLLAFSRKQVLQPQVLDLNAVVSDMEGMLRRTIGEDIRLVSALDPALRPVKADLVQIEQVILNLASNSRDAMPGGGKLTFETSNVVVNSAMAQNHRGLLPGRYSTLAVRDTGAGMDAKTKERIFEPFFTTKENGKGTGLGLATVYGIVKQSGGYIAVESKPRHGTTFRIFLPSEESGVAASRAPQAPIAEAPTGHETILLVEDEEKVRGIVREFLRQSGYTVLEAPNGREALTLAQQHPRIDLLLTDVVMPGLGGNELAQRLSHLRLGLRVVLMSGYSNPGKSALRIAGRDAVLLNKPFSLEELGRKVREVLEAPKK